MPEIALGGMSALDAPPGMVTPARRNPRPGRRGKAGPRLRKFRAHAALVVGSAAFSALMIGIVLNATVMQKEHHPAPLFGSAAPPAKAVAAVPQPAPAVPAPAVSAVPPVAEIAPAPVPARPRTGAEAPTAPSRPKPKDAAKPPAAPHRAGKESDAIGHLLGRPTPAAPTIKSKAAPVPAKGGAAPVRPVHAQPLPAAL